MHTFQVLGITLADHSAREAMRKVEDYLKDGQVSTICFITAAGLLEAESHPETAAFLEKMKLTIAADTDVLKAARLLTRNRQREIENNDFLRLFMHRVVRSRIGICLLSDSKEALASMEEGLASYQASLNVVGRFVVGDLSEEGNTDEAEENLVNDINVLAPKVIISNLSTPLRETFFEKHHMKLHADVWLILKDNMVIGDRRPNLCERVKKLFAGKALERSVDQYKKGQLKSDTKEIDTEAVRNAEQGKNPQK